MSLFGISNALLGQLLYYPSFFAFKVNTNHRSSRYFVSSILFTALSDSLTYSFLTLAPLGKQNSCKTWYLASPCTTFVAGYWYNISTSPDGTPPKMKNSSYMQPRFGKETELGKKLGGGLMLVSDPTKWDVSTNSYVSFIASFTDYSNIDPAHILVASSEVMFILLVLVFIVRVKSLGRPEGWRFCLGRGGTDGSSASLTIES